MAISRRHLLRSAGVLALAPFAPAACVSGGSNVETESSAGVVLGSEARLPKPFTVPLPVPPVLSPVRTDATTDHYEITQQASRVEILPGYRTEVWGYHGTFPGPTIESRRGRQTVVRHTNELPVPVVVHLHGGKTPPEHDGYPTDLLVPAGWSGGEHTGTTSQTTRDYIYPMDQPAATLWYHDHRMDFTGPQVYKGLAGFHLVRDEEEEALPLPRGDRDIPLMIADRSFSADGALHYPSVDPSLRGTPGVTEDFMSGVLGDCILVNGAPWPVLEVDAVRYRFRILNASNARRYRLALDPAPPQGPSFTQIGSDVGLLDAPREHQNIQIAQAERYDVIVDFTRYRVGDKITLVNELGAGNTAKVLRFVVARKGKDDSRIPGKLAELRPVSRDQATVERELTFVRGGAEESDVTLWTINGQPFDPNRMDAEPRLGAVEVWQVRAQNVAHPIHIHLAPFQILSRGGGSLRDLDGGWKDTIDLDNGESAELLLKFDGYRGRYVFHCHNLEHEDMMMMGNFKVV